MEHLKYPIGHCDETWAQKSKQELIKLIKDFPTKVKHLVESHPDTVLLNTYRPDGWTAAQVIHHCADSHMQAYARMKLALTEDHPTIKSYFEDRWAMLPDASNIEVEPSISLLLGLHHRWGQLFENLDHIGWSRTFFHPESQRSFDMKSMAAQYAWHGAHHFAHLQLAFK